MRQFIFCHGFGFDKHFWDPLAPYFKNEQCTYLDLGYFGPVVPFTGNANHSLIGIGHSLGLSKLLSLNKPFDYLIGLNSFINFLGYNPLLRQQREQELTLLKQHFIQSPLPILKGFYQRCGLPECINSGSLKQINKNDLLADLDSLYASVKTPTIPTLIIGTKDDPIVPPVVLHDNFDQCSTVKLDIISKGKHGLGFFKTDIIYKKIIRFINASI
jgi:pimeloyl-[acyl-carrier protein] methyl ester esterase